MRNINNQYEISEILVDILIERIFLYSFIDNSNINLNVLIKLSMKKYM